jgi:hypothetical protein
MTDKRRLLQFLHVKETIAGLNLGELTFKKLKALLVKRGRVMEGVSPERYTAMVLSYYRGNTTDEDVLWHF